MSRYQQILQSATEFAVIVTERDGTITEWNTGAERTLGWRADEVVGQNAEVFFTPEDREGGQLRKEMVSSLREGHGVDERWQLKADGTRFWASGEMMPLRERDGEHLGFVKILRDRTEQHHADVELERSRNELLRSERKWRGLFVDMQEGFYVGVAFRDAVGRMVDYRYLETNPAFENLTGFHGAAGRLASEVAPETVAATVARYSPMLDSGEPVVFEVCVPDAGDRWFEMRARPLDRDRYVVIFADIDARKQAERRIAASEAKWRGLFENLHEGFVLAKVVRDASGRIVDWRYEEVNRAWGEFVGIDPASVIGRTVREVIPGVEDEWVTGFGNVVDTGEASRFTREAGTLGRCYDGVCQPAGDDRFTVIFLEVTERVRAEQRREALRQLSDALLRLDGPDAMARAAEETVGKALAVGRVGYGIVLEDGETFVVPTDWTADGYPSLAGTYRIDDYGGYAEELRHGRTVVIPDIRLDPRTSVNTKPLENLAIRTLVNLPIVEAGRMVAILYVNDDKPRNWTEDEVAFLQDAALRTRTAIERRRAERLLRASDERQRLSLAIGQVGTFDLDLATGLVLLDERARAAFGILDGRPVTQDLKLGAVHSDDRLAFDRVFQAAAGGETFDLEFRTVGIDDGKLRWVALQGRVIDGQRFIGAVREVTDRVVADEQRVVLNRELAHRLKNTLAIVQSIATQTLRIAPDMPTARATLVERIQTLSKAHDILMSGHRDAAPIRAVVETASRLHDEGDRVRMSGPDLALGPKAALTLSLIVHELSTNAGKYGALSVEGGYVKVTWSVAPDPKMHRPVLTWEWREVGGPRVTAPARKSFGTQLIEMGVSGSAEGTSKITYAPEGVVCRITASLTELQAEDDVPV